MARKRQEVEESVTGPEVSKPLGTEKFVRLPPIPRGYRCAPPPPPVPEYLRLPPPMMLGRPEGWVCRRCTEWWNWHPYRPPAESELDAPCAECRKTMDAEERAVEVNRLLLARLSSGSNVLSLPVPTVALGQPSRVNSSTTESTPALACTVDEAGQRLGCKRTVIFKLLREGQLAAAPKLGRRRMVLTASVDALLEAGGVGAVPEPRQLPRTRGPRTASGKILAAEIAKLPVE